MRRNFPKMEAIEDAIGKVELLEPGENFTYQAIADKYCLNRSTLSRRHRGCQALNKTKYINQ
jgi:hypothetical protein